VFIILEAKRIKTRSSPSFISESEQKITPLSRSALLQV